MISTDEAGTILARLAIADEEFLQALLLAAQNAEERLLPGDVKTLEAWARIMRLLRISLTSTAIKDMHYQE